MRAIDFENVSKRYRLGEVGRGSLKQDLGRAWSQLTKRVDPLEHVGERNERETAGGDFVWALKDISFSVEQGEIFGIIGRNGAGKSTLLKLLSRITAPTAGRIRARGRIASLLEVGTGFHPELTGRENIYLNGAILGMTRQEIRRRLDEIVEFSGCAKYIDTPVKRFSSGMLVRLGFAVAAHLECEIMVVDEVLAVGDVSFQKKCIGRVSEVAHGGKTVLFVSHNMQSVEQLCTRACMLDRGELAMVGRVSEAISQYFGSFSDKSVEGLSTNLSRPGTGAARFSQIRLQDGQDKDTSAFEKGNPARVAFRVDVLKSVQRLVVTIDMESGMTRQNATSIVRLISAEELSAGASLEFVVEFSTSTIRPGIYPLRYTIGDGADTVYDSLEEGTRPLSIIGDGQGRMKGVFDIPSRLLKSPEAKHSS